MTNDGALDFLFSEARRHPWLKVVEGEAWTNPDHPCAGDWAAASYVLEALGGAKSPL